MEKNTNNMQDKLHMSHMMIETLISTCDLIAPD